MRKKIAILHILHPRYKPNQERGKMTIMKNGWLNAKNEWNAWISISLWCDIRRRLMEWEENKQTQATHSVGHKEGEDDKKYTSLCYNDRQCDASIQRNGGKWPLGPLLERPRRRGRNKITRELRNKKRRNGVSQFLYSWVEQQYCHSTNLWKKKNQKWPQGTTFVS